jgi:hypothetical protein
MVIRAGVGDQPNVGVLVDGLCVMISSSGSGGLVRYIVDMVVLVNLAIGFHHWSLVSFAGEAIFLQMVFLFALPADHVGVPDRGGGGAGLVAIVALAIVPGAGDVLVVPANDSDLVQLLVSHVVPDDLSGLLILKVSLDGGNAVEPLVVVLDFRLRANLTLSVKVSLASSRTLSWMPSFNPARKSWCLTNLKASVMPSALTSAGAAPAPARTAAMAAGILSVRRL